MSLLLEMHKNEIPTSYMALFPHLLQPVLWERTGNIPPLVRLLQAYLERGANTIASAAADKIVSWIDLVRVPLDTSSREKFEGNFSFRE